MALLKEISPLGFFFLVPRPRAIQGPIFNREERTIPDYLASFVGFGDPAALALLKEIPRSFQSLMGFFIYSLRSSKLGLGLNKKPQLCRVGVFFEVANGFEPPYKVLQTSA